MQALLGSTHLADVPVPTHTWPFLQSVFVVQTTTTGGCEVGGTQTPDLHWSPCGQFASVVHCETHPWSVQIWPSEHCEEPVHFWVGGGLTG